MYAIRAMVLIASEKGGRTGLATIVEETGAPSAFMAKVLQKLVHAGILDSVKGHGGGFAIPARKAANLRLGAVVSAIDGDALFKGCALGFPRCGDHEPCPIHDRVVRARTELRTLLADTRIADLGRGLLDGESLLKDKVR